MRNREGAISTATSSLTNNTTFTTTHSIKYINPQGEPQKFQQGAAIIRQVERGGVLEKILSKSTGKEEEKVKVIAEMQEITCATLRELGRRNFLREGGEKFSH